MKNCEDLSVAIAAALVLFAFSAPSASAESRHHGGTRGSHSGSGHSSSGHSSSGRSFTRPSFARPSFGRTAPRSESRGYSGRSFGSRWGGAPRTAPRVSPEWRGSRGSAGRSVPHYGRNYNDGHRFYGRGRIERIARYRGGYHVWLGGWGHPFFLPYRFYNPFRFRLGISIGLNAFYDPLGYYTVYGSPGAYPPVDSGADVYRDDGDSASASVRGTVQSVDLNTGIVTISDEASRRLVTALLPPRDRRVDEIRSGDYVELSGEWVRGRAYELDANRMDGFEHNR